LKDKTFREMARAHPQIAPLHELRHTLSQLRLNELAVGSDKRNRCLLSPFRSKTGRNQPSNARFVFGPSTWLRGLIQPSPGCGLAYVDFASQEIGIAAALSRDPALMAAYVSGDVYLSFAKQAGLAPPDATKASHGVVRDACKALVLGIGYGMGEDGLAARLGQPKIVARDLLKLHKATYPRFWRWSQAIIDRAVLYGSVSTAFGWTLHTGVEVNPRSLMNFPMQSNGSEMLRLACCCAVEAGLSLSCPVHDAILLEAPLDRLDEDVARLRFCMAKASRDVLDGFEIRTEAKCVRWPGRYTDPRGAVMWERIMGLLNRLERQAA
jgi:DNA polymerase I